ncbi:MAG: DUF4783 domain-containing protein [Bacteroidia bacterium]|jgi:hypothetical protein|nr:DUF4783 domain-containing protein [Bacteroidota bacterium]
MKKYLYLFIAIQFITINAMADSFDDMMMAMKNAQTTGITKFFSNSVELTLLENEGIYSKQQSEQMLKNFFAQHPPKNVNIQHKGSSAQGAKYAIITYEASNGRFRTYIFMKDNGQGLQVNEFRIERE